MPQGKKQLAIFLTPDGNIKVETHNIKGKQCLQYMALLTELLQARITDSEFTQEYYEAPVLNEIEDMSEVKA